MISIDDKVMRSDGPFVGDELVGVVVHAVLVLADIVLAAAHKVKKAGDVDLDLFVVRKAACSI